jgi:hypothetical protein
MLEILQDIVWYNGVGMLLLCLVLIIEEQIRTRLKELKDRMT